MRGTQFNVAQLLKEPIGATRDYDLVIPVAHLAPELAQSEPLEGHIHLLRTNRGILVEGWLSGHIVTTCGRCLADFELPVTIRLQEEFRPTIDVWRGIYLEVDEEDEALLISEHHILDLGEVVRQMLLLEIPMQPLCRSDCAGLCPTCGADLNLGPCDCLAIDVDPRWEALSALVTDVNV